MTQPDAQSASSPPTPIEFWNRFRFFPLRFDEYSFNHWYIYVIGFYFIGLLTDILWDIRQGFLCCSDGFYYFGPAFNFSLSEGELTHWPFILWSMGLFLIALPFNRWRASIPSIFQMLLNKRHISSVSQASDISQDYKQFLEEYQRALLSNKRYILIGVSVIIPLIVILIWWKTYGIPDLAYMSKDPLLLAIEWSRSVLFGGIFDLLLAYFFGVGAWMMYITGFYIRNLTIKFDLTIQPGHPDNCGGLRLFGDFCLGIALPVLMGAVLLGLYSIGNIFHVIPFWTSAVNVGLIVFVLPLAAVAFFVPLWNIHLKMIKKRRMYEDEFAGRFMKLEEKIHTSLDKGELDNAKSAKEEIEILQILHPNKIGYPVWPFDSGILFKFLIPQIVAVLILVVQLGPVVDTLRKIFHLS